MNKNIILILSISLVALKSEQVKWNDGYDSRLGGKYCNCTNSQGHGYSSKNPRYMKSTLTIGIKGCDLCKDGFVLTSGPHQDFDIGNGSTVSNYRSNSPDDLDSVGHTVVDCIKDTYNTLNLTPNYQNLMNYSWPSNDPLLQCLNSAHDSRYSIFISGACNNHGLGSKKEINCADCTGDTGGGNHDNCLKFAQWNQFITEWLKNNTSSDINNFENYIKSLAK